MGSTGHFCDAVSARGDLNINMFFAADGFWGLDYRLCFPWSQQSDPIFLQLLAFTFQSGYHAHAFSQALSLSQTKNTRSEGLYHFFILSYMLRLWWYWKVVQTRKKNKRFLGKLSVCLYHSCLVINWRSWYVSHAVRLVPSLLPNAIIKQGFTDL